MRCFTCDQTEFYIYIFKHTPKRKILLTKFVGIHKVNNLRHVCNYSKELLVHFPYITSLHFCKYPEGSKGKYFRNSVNMTWNTLQHNNKLCSFAESSFKICRIWRHAFPIQVWSVPTWARTSRPNKEFLNICVSPTYQNNRYYPSCWKYSFWQCKEHMC